MNDYAKLLLVILFWAGNYPLGKLGLAELSPLVLTAGRAVLAAPLLFLVARVSAPLAVPLRRRDYLAFTVLGLTGLVANTTVWYWGLRPPPRSTRGSSAPRRRSSSRSRPARCSAIG